MEPHPAGGAGDRGPRDRPHLRRAGRARATPGRSTRPPRSRPGDEGGGVPSPRPRHGGRVPRCPQGRRDLRSARPQLSPAATRVRARGRGVSIVVTDQVDTVDAEQVDIVTLDGLDGPAPAPPRTYRCGPRTPPTSSTRPARPAEPKGVVVDHASVVGLIERESRIAVRPGQTVAQLAPAAFDASVFEIWGALAGVAASPSWTRRSPSPTSVPTCADGRPTGCSSPPDCSTCSPSTTWPRSTRSAA